MSNQLTVLIPTSPIPIHPSTAILDETVLNIRKYTDAEIIMMMDGVHESLAHRTEAYEQYRKAVIEKIDARAYGNCYAIDFEHHTHQAEMTRYVLKNNVQTPLIMFCEHDTSPIGDIPFKEICNVVQYNAEIKYMRFNIFHTILPEHRYLMLDKKPQNAHGVKYIKTLQWSQRPHIAHANMYREILFDYFYKREKTMIEDVMHSVVISRYSELGYDTFGLSIYTPDGNQYRSYHSDGRQSDEKIITG